MNQLKVIVALKLILHAGCSVDLSGKQMSKRWPQADTPFQKAA